MLTDDDLAAMRAMTDTGAACPHWDGCHRSHPRCAVAALLAEVGRLRAGLAAERERCAGVVDRWLVGECRYEAHNWCGSHRCWAIRALAAAIRKGEGPTDG